MKILVIPDTQVSPEHDWSFLAWIGRYAGTKRPDYIVHLGDHFDMPSLSSYDKGTGKAEGRRVVDDLAAGNAAIDLLERSMRKEAPRRYRPRKTYIIGNHDQRIEIAANADPKMLGLLSMDSMRWRESGWSVSEFLRPVKISGIVFQHYFNVAPNGGPSPGKYGCPSAAAQVRRVGYSAVAGHRQGLDTAMQQTPFGTKRGVIAGSSYPYDFDYLGANNYWRGVLMLHEVTPDGDFSIMEVSTKFLREKYS